MRSASFFSHTLTAMESRFFIRRDLVKTFPSSYNILYSGLTLHFTSEYLRVVGSSSAPKSVIHTLVSSFKQLWNKVNNKKQFLSQPKCSKWLDQVLPELFPASDQLSLHLPVLCQASTPIQSPMLQSTVMSRPLTQARQNLGSEESHSSPCQKEENKTDWRASSTYIPMKFNI